MTRTCSDDLPTFVSHDVDIPVCCPVSKNPRPGSLIRFSYFPTAGIVIPVENLVDWVDEYVNGHQSREVRNMEEMIQDLALRCAQEVNARVRVTANLIIQPPYGGGEQRMRVTVRA